MRKTFIVFLAKIDTRLKVKIAFAIYTTKACLAYAFFESGCSFFIHTLCGKPRNFIKKASVDFQILLCTDTPLR